MSGRAELARASTLVAACGTTPNIGVTLLAFSVAYAAAMAMPFDDAAVAVPAVAYVCLNLRSSKLHRYLGVDHPPMTLDGWRAELRSGRITPERLRGQLAWRPSGGGWPRALHVLFGNQLREQGDYYTPDELRHLLNLIRQAFPVCIVETNAYWDNAATLVALEQADRRLLVTTPELGHFQEDGGRWFGTIAPLLGMSADSFRLAVNRPHAGGTGGLTAREAATELGVQLAAEFPHVPDAARLINTGRLLELAARRLWHREAAALAGELRMLPSERACQPAGPPLPRHLWRGRRKRDDADGTS